MSDYSKYRVSWKERIILALVLVITCEGLGILLYDTYYGPLILVLIYPLCEKKYSEVMVNRRRDRLRNQFRDVLYSLSSSFVSGQSMTEALMDALPKIKALYGENCDMVKELKLMIHKIHEAAMEEGELWSDLGERSGIEDIKDFADVFSGARDAGGNLVHAVDNATTVLTEKIGIENEIRIMASQKVTEGRLVGLMPVIMIVFLRLSSPDYISVMYETLAGKTIMTLSLFITIGAFLVTERITRIEV